MGLFSAPGPLERARKLYARFKPMRASGRLEAEQDGVRLEVFGRGCGGGASLVVREVRGDQVAYAMLALHADDGIEQSSFGSAAAALDFVESVARRLGL
ncbi:hypothetical protein [Magnetospirillum sp. UT-4]|uniref:hypothetical protein n=1 Tax=Magnetospirillum sp. UT-4 TaxID=2681467 RepID=UPI00137D3517|nr:hypothetical protein [Magnetospirillum sp. UT-4]CAA7620728.1 hypothetical protein MTBUT4_370020 [Magnetospirillum sp. UT-4]